VTYYEQQVIDRDDAEAAASSLAGQLLARPQESVRADERAARASLRAQIARLERERAAIVAQRFPYIAAPAPIGASSVGGPALLDLGQLERLRDRMAADLQELHARVRARTEHERRAREQLARMRLEPGRYKFARLPVRDLGLGVCGVWEVRPRLGLIGMLAGWWQLKLSSGCPLAKGSRRGPRPRPQALAPVSPPAREWRLKLRSVRAGCPVARRSQSRTGHD
jgi:hypothetical protein